MALLQADYRADAVARQRRGKKSHKSQPAFNMEVVRGVAGQVYGQMKFGRLHYRQIRRFLALENPAGIHRCLAVGVWQVGAVTREATGEDIFAPSVQRSHAVPRSERYNPFPPGRLGQKRP